MLIFVLGLVFLAEWVVLDKILPTTAETSSLALAVVEGIVWHFFWLNLVISYLRCVFTDPGTLHLILLL